MKKEYTTPYAEKVNFNYKDQVVASNAAGASECFFETSASYSTMGCVSKQGEGSMNN